jgi:hypothetical protein
MKRWNGRCGGIGCHPGGLTITHPIALDPKD